MALPKKVYGVKQPFSAPIFSVDGVADYRTKSRNTVVPQSEIGNLAGLELKRQFVSDKGYEFGIRRFSLGTLREMFSHM